LILDYDFDASSLDDWPPRIHLAIMKCGKSSQCLSVARGDLLTGVLLLTGQQNVAGL